MRILCLALALALAVSASTQSKPRKLADVRLADSTGKDYDLQAILAGKPVLLVFLRPKFIPLKVEKNVVVKYAYRGFQDPNRIADLNRLSTMAKGKLKVVGLTICDSKDLSRFAKDSGAKFPLLADPNTYGRIDLLTQILLDNGSLHHLQTALILPNGTIAEIWPGYSRSSLSQVQRIVRQRCGISLRLNLASFPARVQQGEAQMYGLPRP